MKTYFGEIVDHGPNVIGHGHNFGKGTYPSVAIEIERHYFKYLKNLAMAKFLNI